ncbi:hypothetical protein E2562_036853 [Oryza meyeriana var. granulata]|uniref:Uncharacterized protein n=1 Tax=Oryza meyeriana var. granulata TaxID=110450 RepID=A0A6G1E7L2_9ORYZ|nr:hypothetical protein E2562_036853 [Oryza meyeriana var. granulata]
MDEWEELAGTVRGTLMLVGSRMEEAVRMIGVAHGKLQQRANLVRSIRQGTAVAIALNNFADPDPERICPTDILKEARREITQSAARHAMAGHVFVRYAAHHGIQHEPPSRSWDAHYQEAVGHLDEAIKKVSDAVGHYAAADDIVAILEAFVLQPETFARWAHAAELLIKDAASDAALALDKVRRSRLVVADEFLDASKILHCGGARPASIKLWREAALTVLGTFRLIGTIGMEAFGLIEVALSKFEEHSDLLRRVRQGTPEDVAVDNFADAVPEDVLLSTVILEIAHHEISQTAVRHAKIHHIFVRYAAYLRIQDNPVYRSWNSHHQDAVGHFKEALSGIRHAVSSFQVAKDAVSMIGVLPNRCPIWEGWALKAHTFTVLARLYASVARDDVGRARQAVSLEFIDAWTILRQRR